MLRRRRPGYSLVVPLLGPIPAFEDTLASLLRHQPAGCQIIVVHDGAYTDPHQIEGEVDFIRTHPAARLGEMFGTALRISNSPIVGMVRPGIVLDEGWELPVAKAFQDRSVAALAPVIIDEARPDRIVSAGVRKGPRWLRCNVGQGKKIRRAGRLKPLGPTSWAAFYRRSAIDMLGTADQNLNPVYFDIDIALGLHRLGFDCQFAPELEVSTGQPAPILAEFRSPHGDGAARARIRFGDTEQGSILTDNLIEILQAPVRPWLLRHVIQKLSARSMRDIDHAFAIRLNAKHDELHKFDEEYEIRRAA